MSRQRESRQPDGVEILKTAAAVYLIAVVVDYPWELAQARLFRTDAHEGGVLVHCFVASLGDGVMLLLLYALTSFVTGRVDLYRRPGLSVYTTLLLGGAVLAVAVEWMAVHVLGRWSYAEAMPQLPFFDVGLVPVLQMLILPPLIVRILGRVVDRS